ncbi:MAG: hypothetical protein PVF91_10570 [Chromatiales bacterium]
MDELRVLKLYGIPDDNKVSMDYSPEAGPRFSAAGNCPLPVGLAGDRLRIETLYVGRFREQDPPRLGSPPALVINALCNPDIQRIALRQAQGVCAEAAQQGVPVANPPERVEHSAREALPGLLGGTPGLEVPAVVRLQAPSLESLKALLAGGEIPYPFTIGPAAQTDGLRVVRIEDEGALWKLDMLPFDGRAFHLSPVPDFWGEDGLYRRLRMIRIGSRLLPGHLLIGERWDLHRRPRRFMAGRPGLQAQEQAFLADPFGYLGRDRTATVREAFDRLGLDFAALDLAPFGDGLLLLGCGACFDAFARNPRFAYLAPHARALADAMREMILSRAAAR